MNTKIIKIIIFFVGFLLLFSVASTYAGSVSIELKNVLSSQNNRGKVDVIVEFTDKLSPFEAFVLNDRRELIEALKSKQINSQASVKKFLGLFGIKVKDLWLNNSVAVTIPARLVSRITSLKHVAVVKLDKKIVLNSSGQGSSPSQIDWNISAIGADSVWNIGTTGAGVVIGSMDTGVDINHPDLSSQWRAGTNSWFDPYGIYPTPHDSNGHGTQTTSLLVGGNASGYSIGVAPDTQWIAAKIFDDSDTASLSAIHQAFQWMLDPDGDSSTDDGADIINNSWNFGSTVSQCDTEFQNDIFMLRAVNIAVVFSAGNSGPNLGTSQSPANNEDTIPVGSIDESLNIGFSSSRGPSACGNSGYYPKLVAPGINVLTADLTFGGAVPNSYTYSGGTSFAAPHVSGSLALLQSKYPSSSLSERESALYITAAPLGSINDYGNGIVDVNAAQMYMGTAQLVSPQGNIGTNSSSTFIWNAVPDSTNYRLWLKNTSTGSVVIDQLYTATESGCDIDTSCSITPNITLENGDYRWLIRTKNGAVWGPNSSAMLFTIGSPQLPPGAATLVSPSGDIGAISSPTFEWDSVAETTDYRLWLKNTSTGSVVIDQLYTATESGCDIGTSCSLTASITLENGDYRWLIRTKNGSVWGPNSSAMLFIVAGIP
jgi:bacillopeptidase F